MGKSIYSLLISLFIWFYGNAQDPQFSHLYAIPLHLGPSFAGSTGGTRAAINIRDQWTAIQQEYVTYSAMIDHYFYGTRNGLGIILMRDLAGAGKLSTSSIQAQYSYSINLNKNFAFRPGLQLGYIHRAIDYSKITFGDQLHFTQNNPSSIEPSLNDDVNYFDFSTSLLGIYKNYWLGSTLEHIIKPNQSLLLENSTIPLRFIMYAGAKLSVQTNFNKKRKRENVYMMIHFNRQDKAKQAYLGSYWEHNSAIVGFWYRGIPFTKAYESYINNDALIIMLGIKKADFTFLYSYDFTISKLVANTAGSQEITLSWNFKNSSSEKSKKNRMNVVPCPMSDGPRNQYHKPNSM